MKINTNSMYFIDMRLNINLYFILSKIAYISTYSLNIIFINF